MNSLVVKVFSGLVAVLVEDVADGADVVLVAARTWGDPVPYPMCTKPTPMVHRYRR
ncbi:hypothetical protein [Streptomyces kronopolitis]